MQFLNDILSSIKGNTKARANDPIMGTFVITWVFFNWNKLATLLWGTDNVDQRIANLSTSMSVFTDLSLLWSDKDLLFFPSIFTMFYLFVFPSVSLWVKKRQNRAILLQHTHAVELDIQQAETQKDSNKAVLRANPEKEFLAEEVRMDLLSEKNILELRHKTNQLEADNKKHEADIKKARAEEQRLEFLIKKDQAEKERIELDNKKRQEVTEKNRFNVQTAIHKATMASSRFPAVYQLMDTFSKSLREDGITLSLNGLASSIATLFGYSSAKEMLDDPKFNNEGLNKVKYLYHDSSFLAKRLDQIAKDEGSDNEDLSGDMLFDHLQTMLENYPFELLSDDLLAEHINVSIDENKYDILSSGALSDAMAITNTFFEDIELEVIHSEFQTDFKVVMTGYASGYYRKAPSIPGQKLSVEVIATCTPVVGKFGLSDYQLKTSGSLIDDGDDEPS